MRNHTCTHKRATGYHARCMAQSLQWIEGCARHNYADDECTPDFSCCVPSLFETDRAKRIESHNAWCRRHGYAEFSDD